MGSKANIQNERDSVHIAQNHHATCFARDASEIDDYFPMPQDEHSLDPSYEFTEPTADPKKVAIMKDLQKFVSVGLVAPVGEEHMYFAAMNSNPAS